MIDRSGNFFNSSHTDFRCTSFSFVHILANIDTDFKISVSQSPRLRQQPGPGPGRLGSALGGKPGWWGRGRVGGLGLPTVSQAKDRSQASQGQSGKATYCQAKLPTVRQAKDRCQAKQRQSGMRPRVPAYMHPTAAYFAPNRSIDLHPTPA